MTDEEKRQLEEALEFAERSRDQLVDEREEKEREITKHNKLIAALSEMLGKTSSVDIGITEATLLAIRVADTPLTPTEIRDELRLTGFRIDEFSNPMASLHQVIKRLEDKGEIKEASKDGRKAWTKAGIGRRIMAIGESPSPKIRSGFNFRRKSGTPTADNPPKK